MPPASGGFDVANAVTLGALGVGAVGSLVYALYADRAMMRRLVKFPHLPSQLLSSVSVSNLQFRTMSQVCQPEDDREPEERRLRAAPSNLRIRV